jgi:hypothetical protein
MKLGFWKWKGTAGIENAGNLPTWHAEPIR